jgi:hypothetical protein
MRVALSFFSGRKTWQPFPGEKSDGMIAYRREISTQATPHDIFRVLSSLGGKTGWLYATILWRLRGYFDELIGDVLDFWRVETLVPDQLLRLRAEMKVPGKAWLQFEIIPQDKSWVCIRQTAYYEPKGLIGQLYWYVLYPIHIVIFQGMITTIAHKAEALSSTREKTPA